MAEAAAAASPRLAKPVAEIVCPASSPPPHWHLPKSKCPSDPPPTPHPTLHTYAQQRPTCAVPHSASAAHSTRNLRDASQVVLVSTNEVSRMADTCTPPMMRRMVSLRSRLASQPAAWGRRGGGSEGQLASQLRG
eukprot:98341-Chlamydomonas_euryale.AAC.1